MNIILVVCWSILIPFVIWALYIQMVAWRRSKGFKPAMEMSLVDRVHDEMVYQFGYKRGYWIEWKVNDVGYWMLKDTDCPRWKAKLLTFWVFVNIMALPYSYRTLKVKDFDDMDTRYIKEGEQDGKDGADS
jgi:hypothetical protein